MAAAGVLAGCTSAGPSLAVTTAARTTVDGPLHVRVTGAPAGQDAVVGVESTDATGTLWRSSATYAVGKSGTVDADTAASVKGTYTGVSGTGLVWSMRPVGKDDAAYIWRRGGPSSFRVTVEAGDATASTTFERGVTATELQHRDTSLESDGFVGELWSPPAGTQKRPAVLVIGGSEGGMNAFLAASLAAHGYPSLAVAYFRAPGLPQTLSAIPLEYFERALDWLAAQPEVDPARIVVVGGSRGSEAAELLAVHDPDRVHGLIGASPSNVVGCSYPGCDGPAWTLGGAAVPYTRTWDDPRASDDPRAVIPLAKTRGPVLLVCGEADDVWTSCAFSRTATAALDADPRAPRHELVAEAGAGHYVAGLVPGEPVVSPSELTAAQHARDEAVMPDVWRHVLAFLAALDEPAAG